jgi:hypothetical protein
MFVAKRSAAGNWEWIQTVSSAGVVGIAVDGQGSVIVAGSFIDTARFGSTVLYNTQVVQQTGSQGAYVAKLSAAGQWQWAQMIGEYSATVRGRTLAKAVAVDGAGNAVFTGTFNAPAVYAGTTLLYNVDSLNQGMPDLFVAKVSANGQWLWAQAMGYAATDDVFSVAVDQSGNTYLTGLSGNDARLGFAPTVTLQPRGRWWRAPFVAKLDAVGRWRWAQGMPGGVNNAAACYATVRSERRLIISGGFRSDTVHVGATTLLNAAGPNPNPRTPDVVVAEIDSAGQWQWAVQGGGGDNEYIGQAFYRDGRIYVGGGLSPTSLFGSHSVPTWGAMSLLVATLDTLGTWQHVLAAASGGYSGCELIGFDGAGRLLLVGGSDLATIELPPFALPAQPVAGSSGNSTIFLARLRADALLSAPDIYPLATTLEVWPNPATTAIQITGPAPGTRVELLDLLGRMIGRGGVMPPAGALKLPLELARGVYVVRAGARTRRLVIE